MPKSTPSRERVLQGLNERIEMESRGDKPERIENLSNIIINILDKYAAQDMIDDMYEELLQLLKEE